MVTLLLLFLAICMIIGLVLVLALPLMDILCGIGIILGIIWIWKQITGGGNKNGEGA